MRGDEAAGTDGAPEALEGLKEEFSSALRDLRRKQRSAVEKALGAVDRKKIAKIRKTLDDIQR